MKYSLCIPTMRRWNFLEKYIPLYLENPFIDEIVLVDETGEDFIEISAKYSSEPKIRVYQNEKRLGPFLNKVKCMKYAKNNWICLVDSDNFVDLDYFNKVNALAPLDDETVYIPSFAAPTFDFRNFNGLLLTKESIAEIYKTDLYISLEILLNTGNYVLSKKAVDVLTRYEDNTLSASCTTIDVLYANYNLLRNGFKLYVVPDLTYTHVVHEGSIFIQESREKRNINMYMESLFRIYLEE